MKYLNYFNESNNINSLLPDNEELSSIINELLLNEEFRNICGELGIPALSTDALLYHKNNGTVRMTCNRYLGYPKTPEGDVNRLNDIGNSPNKGYLFKDTMQNYDNFLVSLTIGIYASYNTNNCDCVTIIQLEHYNNPLFNHTLFKINARDQLYDSGYNEDMPLIDKEGVIDVIKTSFRKFKKEFDKILPSVKAKIKEIENNKLESVSKYIETNYSFLNLIKEKYPNAWKKLSNIYDDKLDTAADMGGIGF